MNRITNMAKKRKNLKRLFSKLALDHSAREVVEAVLGSISWEEFLRLLVNLCASRSNSAETGPQRKAWYARARIFHRAMDETYLKKDKKPIFRTVRQDIYHCKCGKKFRVDPARQENIRWSMEQTEFVVTCPECGRSEDMTAAKGKKK